MKQVRFGLSLAGLMVALVAPSSQAQTHNITLTAPYAPGGGIVTAFGYYMSPYTGTVDGATYRFNCVDFFHDVDVGDVYTATVTNIGKAAQNVSLLANTRDGSSGGYASLAAVLTLYEQAAWLTDQITRNPATDPNRTIAIQTAIWSIVDNGPTNPASLRYASTGLYWSNGHWVNTIQNNGAGSTGYWVNRAQIEYALQSDTYYDKFNIITGAGAVGGPKQEFVYGSPEPGTFVLIGTGMLGVAAVVRRRRKARLVECAA